MVLNEGPLLNIEDETSEVASQISLTSEPAQATIKLSWRRWPVLFAFSLFGLTSFLTEETSCILHTMLELLDLPLDRYVYIGLISSNIVILTTMPTAWFVDRYGIKIAMYVTTFLMLLRNGFKALLFNPYLPYWQEFKMSYWIISTTINVQILTTYYCMPLKISESWFSKSERSFAWVVMMSSGSIGISLAAFFYPRFIHSVKDVKPLFYLNLISAIVTAATVFLCITRSKPKHPPNERMITSLTVNIPYFKSLKKMVKHRDMMIHLLNLSIYEGFAISILTVLQDMLVNSGHDEVFVGNLISINSIISLVAIIGLSTLVHRSTSITLVCKLAASVRVIVFAVYMMIILYSTPGWVVILVSIISQIGMSWASPNFNNMTAHIASGVVSEATVAGFTTTLVVLWMSIGKAIFVALIEKHGSKSDYTNSVFTSITVCVLTTVIYVLSFKGKKMEDLEQ